MTTKKDTHAVAETLRPERRPCDQLHLHAQESEVPPMSEGEFAALKHDIAQFGLQVPVEITSEGVVLDGRARLRAARELGHTEIDVQVVTPADELEHMLRAALLRRQLIPSQRAAIAAKLAGLEQLRADAADRQRANLRQGPERATSPARDELPAVAGRTRARIAELAGTGERTVQDVITVHTHDPALFERISRGEISAHTAASKVRRALRDAQITPAGPMPDGLFGLIYADPPWSFGSPDSNFAPDQHYPTMTTTQIKSLVIPAAENCVLFLWACNSLLLDALDVIRAWGFGYRNNLVWIKNGIGPGVWVRQRHELLLIATRGDISPPEPEDRVDSVIEAPRGRHSEKPEAAYERIERMYPNLPKLELFARGTPRPGWQAWGNQTEPAAQPATAAEPADGQREKQ